MSTLAAEQDLAPLVRQQLRELLADPLERKALLGGSMFGPEEQDLLYQHESQLQNMLADENLGMMLTGPTYISGASVIDGTVTAPKISVVSLEAVQTSTGALNVTGTIQVAAAYPATGARIEITAAGLKGYNSTPVQTFGLNVDGSGFLGVGGTALSWTTAGVVSIPVAAIGALTIADIGSGVFGGTYGTASSGTRIELDSTGLKAYSGATNTFHLSSVDGSVSHTGTLTLRTASSGARTEMASAGIRGYNAASTQTFGVSSSDGSGFLGAGSVLTWNSSGTVTINGSVLVSGTVTGTHIASLTIAAGNIASGAVQTAKLNDLAVTGAKIANATIADGKITDLAVGKLTTGSLTSATFTISTGGKIVDGDGSEWSSTGIILKSSGSFGDVIKWQVSGVDKASIYATSTIGRFMYSSGGIVEVSSGGTTLYSGDLSNFLTVGNTGMTYRLGDSAGADQFIISNLTGTQVFGIGSNGDLFRVIANDSTALGSYYGRVPFYINGALRYLAVYN